jgi:hypothetical protein
MWWARRFSVLLITENCCDVDWYGLELRFKKNIDDAWDFDEIVGPCFLHIEQMTDWSCWLAISTETSSKDELCVNIGSVSGRAAVKIREWLSSLVVVPSRIVRAARVVTVEKLRAATLA